MERLKFVHCQHDLLLNRITPGSGLPAMKHPIAHPDICDISLILREGQFLLLLLLLLLLLFLLLCFWGPFVP